MNKTQLHKIIIEALENIRDTAIKAAEQAHETATHTEAIAENKYDTFGLEASYLAEGQSRRVEQADADLHAFTKLTIKDFDDDDIISFGAYITLENAARDLQHLFLSPVAGGITVDYDDKKVMLITGASPLGKALIGSYLDDEVSAGNAHYIIKELF